MHVLVLHGLTPLALIRDEQIMLLKFPVILSSYILFSFTYIIISQNYSLKMMPSIGNLTHIFCYN